MEDTKLVVFKFLFLFVCMLLFFLLVFSFLNYFIGKTLFNSSLPIPKYLPDGNFRN